MLLKTRPPAVLEAAPMTTGEKRLRAWAKTGFDPGANVGLNLAALKVRYGPENAKAPRMYEATFRVPLGASEGAFATEQAHLVYRWIAAWDKRGFDWLRERGVQVYPGIYPYYGPDGPDFGAREFIARAWFRCRKPKVTRLEVRPELLKPPV